MKIFLEVKKFENLFCRLYWQSPLLQSFSELFWNRFTFRIMFWKVHSDRWQLVKISKQHSIIIIIINLLRQVFNVSASSAQRQIFVIALVFDIMQFDNILQKCFNCSYRGSTPLPTRIIEPSTHCVFTCSKTAIGTLEQGVKSVQSQHKSYQNDVKWLVVFNPFVFTFHKQVQKTKAWNVRTIGRTETF